MEEKKSLFWRHLRTMPDVAWNEPIPELPTIPCKCTNVECPNLHQCDHIYYHIAVSTIRSSKENIAEAKRLWSEFVDGNDHVLKVISAEDVMHQLSDPLCFYLLQETDGKCIPVKCKSLLYIQTFNRKSNNECTVKIFGHNINIFVSQWVLDVASTIVFGHRFESFSAKIRVFSPFHLIILAIHNTLTIKYINYLSKQTPAQLYNLRLHFLRRRIQRALSLGETWIPTLLEFRGWHQCTNPLAIDKNTVLFHLLKEQLCYAASDSRPVRVLSDANHYLKVVEMDYYVLKMCECKKIKVLNVTSTW